MVFSLNQTPHSSVNMIGGTTYPSHDFRPLRIEQVPNLTEQENLHHYHKKRAIAPPNNHFTTNTEYTNKILIAGGIVSMVGFAYLLLPFRPRQTYSLFSF